MVFNSPISKLFISLTHLRYRQKENTFHAFFFPSAFLFILFVFVCRLLMLGCHYYCDYHYFRGRLEETINKRCIKSHETQCLLGFCFSKPRLFMPPCFFFPLVVKKMFIKICCVLKTRPMKYFPVTVVYF